MDPKLINQNIHECFILKKLGFFLEIFKLQYRYTDIVYESSFYANNGDGMNINLRNVCAKTLCWVFRLNTQMRRT